ncbi:LSM domain-containing protein [Paenibacillus sp.]|jgi:hypothetical protein|uniref:LSM domain-containing protein n=1 Tax=Paenibacillus sp. TaxID=58172 RepID=UPI00283931E3|nr:LSM domain-containing protein [Paenibacillus sp.]MDR0268111.1 hypothetical protein [Paenibacillus sp.]
MPTKKKKQKSRSSKYHGKPVLVILKDGRSYIGTVNSFDRQGVTLSGLQANHMLKTSILENRDKAQVSGLLSALFGGGGLLGGALSGGASRGGASREGGGGGMFGFFGQIIPNIRIGMNVVRTIMPLFGLLK